MGFEQLCMSCMSDTGGKAVCPHCGWSQDAEQPPHVLPLRTILQDRYLVGCSKSGDAEGVSYLSYDMRLKCTVELKEFFPRAVCLREEDGKQAGPMEGKEDSYQELLVSFLGYARELAHLRDLAALTHPYDIFEENGTAYTVSEWSESIPLRYFVERSGGSLNWNAARQLFMPVLSALSSMHRAGVRHLGISPDTLRIMPDGKMRLGGFGIPAVRVSDMGLPTEWVAGCAAVEQIFSDYEIAECTDIYGFAASLFYALTGTLPLDAGKRRTDSRLLIPTNLLKSIPPHVVSALANGLQVFPKKRTATFERLRAELSASPTVTVTLEDTKMLRSIPSPAARPEKESPPKKEASNYVWLSVSCLVAAVVFTIVGVIWLSVAQAADPAEPPQSVSAGLQSSPSSQAGEEEGALPAMTHVAGEESSEAPKIITPDLKGKNYEALSASVTPDSEYQLLISDKQFSDAIPEGCIISQAPAPDTSVTKGTAIVVVISQGAAVRVLPGVAGKTLPDASEAVTSAGFVPIKKQAYSAEITEGMVIGYEKSKAGSQLPFGSQVVLLVSEGPQPGTVSASSPGVTSAESYAPASQAGGGVPAPLAESEVPSSALPSLPSAASSEASSASQAMDTANSVASAAVESAN